MPYVDRDDVGNIRALSAQPNASAPEFLPVDHPDISAFLNGATASDMRQMLELTDLDMVRITEDLIDVLISKNVINFTDLPAQAQGKLLARKSLRRSLSAIANLVADEDDVL